MIDTITLDVWRSDINEEFYQICLKASNQALNIISTDSVVEKELNAVFREVEFKNHVMRIITGKITIPSSSYGINYRVYDERVRIEFSIPKFLYASNVFQCRKDENGKVRSPYYWIIFGTKTFFETIFSGVSIDYSAVEITRWDYCFNQFYNSEHEAIKALEYFKMLHKGEQNIDNRETGFAMVTKSLYFKIYHKGAEFLKNDLEKVPLYLADSLTKMSAKILRFEKKITKKNIAYQYNMRVLSKTFLRQKSLYMKLKRNEERIPKELRHLFEGVRSFSLGTPCGLNYLPRFYKLNEKFVNDEYKIFKAKIKEKYNIREKEVSALLKHTIGTSGRTKGRDNVMFAFIDRYGSLTNAYNKKAIARSTYYRYKAILKSKNIDEQKRFLPIDFVQDWSYNSYEYELLRNCIIQKNMGRKILL